MLRGAFTVADTITSLIREVILMPEEALTFSASVRLAQIFPDKFILETDDYEFDLDEFAERGHCRLKLDLLSHSQLNADWRGKGKGAKISPRNAVMDVEWNGMNAKVVRIKGECYTFHYIVADSAGVAKALFSQVCRTTTEASGQVLVFARGEWKRDRDLLNAIKSSTLENLILSAATMRSLTADISDFFESEEIYLSLGVPWKRGVLLTGPPGNGKTHAIKSMVNCLGKPCLYVRSLVPNRGTVHGAIQSVFRRAREAAPCILVFEDLDSLIDDKNRSLFLNELDGFASNGGVLTIATTNYPQKLDPALLNRPSRFDRKIKFDLPRRGERGRFLRMMLQGREISDEEFLVLAQETVGFSFAYLKELSLSGLMAWLRVRKEARVADSMLELVKTLKAQMKSEPPTAVVEDEGEDDD
jgi:hypothetical protein